MRIFLTGATGYIGGVLARRLSSGGHELIALVRPTSDPRQLEALGVSTSVGDVTDRYSLRPGMAGADLVIHAAADLDMSAPAEERRRRMEEVNVQGTENVASLAYKLGVGSLLHVSSVARWGGSPPDGSPADEESPLYEPPSTYARTKADADRAVDSWQEQGLEVRRVYPSLVYGPPGKDAGTNALLGALARGETKVLVGADRRLSWVHVDDVVDGICKVIERGEAGRGYLLAGEVATLGEVAGRVCALAGRRPPRLRLPLPVAKGALKVWRWASALGAPEPAFTSEQLESLGRHWAFDDSRARRELGWRPRPLAEGLPPTVEQLTVERLTGQGR